MIKVHELTVTYAGQEQPSLGRISFSLGQGEILAVVGANGSGKSTLCKALVGLIPDYFSAEIEGDYVLQGKLFESYSLEERLRLVGLVFQNPFNQLSYTASTVGAELAYGLENLGIERGEMMKRIQGIGMMCQLENLLDKPPLTLSGGQVQRVALGATLIMEPAFLVLDEPTSQLDPAGSHQLYQQIARLAKQGMSCLLASHDLEVVSQLADWVLVLDQGQQVAFGKPNAVFQSLDLAGLGLVPPDYISLGKQLLEGQFSAERVQRALSLLGLEGVL